MSGRAVAQGISPGDEDAGRDDEKHAEMEDSLRLFIRADPLFEKEPPHIAEQDQHGHVQRPTGETELIAHVEMPHPVKEELEIPEGAAESRHQPVEAEPASTTLGKPEELPGSAVTNQEK